MKKRLFIPVLSNKKDVSAWHKDLFATNPNLCFVNKIGDMTHEKDFMLWVNYLILLNPKYNWPKVGPDIEKWVDQVKLLNN